MLRHRQARQELGPLGAVILRSQSGCPDLRSLPWLLDRQKPRRCEGDRADGSRVMSPASPPACGRLGAAQMSVPELAHPALLLSPVSLPGPGPSGQQHRALWLLCSACGMEQQLASVVGALRAGAAITMAASCVDASGRARPLTCRKRQAG